MVSNAGAIQEAAAITANRALISNANGIPTHALVSDTELGYVAGATGPLQTQIATKATKVTSAVANNFASLTAAGELADSGKKDSDYVHVTGDETIAGNKTFSNQISVNQRILYPIVALSLTSTAGTNNNLTLPEGVFFRIDNATGNFSITGLTGGVDGRMIILFSPNTAGYRLTIANENASSDAGNRIWTCTNSDLQTGATTNSRGIFTLIYSGTDSRWIVTSYIL